MKYIILTILAITLTNIAKSDNYTEDKTDDSKKKIENALSFCKSIMTNKKLNPIKGKIAFPYLTDEKEQFPKIDRIPNKNEKYAILLLIRNIETCSGLFNLISGNTTEDRETLDHLNELSIGNITFADYNKWNAEYTKNIIIEMDQIKDKIKDKKIVCRLNSPASVQGQETTITFNELKQSIICDKGCTTSNININEDAISYSQKLNNDKSARIFISRHTGRYEVTLPDIDRKIYGECNEIARPKF